MEAAGAQRNILNIFGHALRCDDARLQLLVQANIRQLKRKRLILLRRRAMLTSQSLSGFTARLCRTPFQAHQRSRSRLYTHSSSTGRSERFATRASAERALDSIKKIFGVAVGRLIAPEGAPRDAQGFSVSLPHAYCPHNTLISIRALR